MTRLFEVHWYDCTHCGESVNGDHKCLDLYIDRIAEVLKTYDYQRVYAIGTVGITPKNLVQMGYERFRDNVAEEKKKKEAQEKKDRAEERKRLQKRLAELGDE